MSNIYKTTVDNFGGNETYLFSRTELKKFLTNLSSEPVAIQENFKYAIAYPFSILGFCNTYGKKTKIKIEGGTGSKWADPFSYGRYITSVTPYKEFFRFDSTQINNIFGPTTEWTKSDYYAKYTLYLPFAQPIELSANDFKGSTCMRIYVSLDIYSGGMKYYIVREKSGNADVVSTVSCQVGMRIGVTPSTVASAMNSNATGLVTSLVGLGSSIALGVATGGVGAAVGVASSLVGTGLAVHNYSVNTGTSQSVVASGNNASIIDPRNVYIKRVWSKPYTPTNFNFTHGRVSSDSIVGKKLTGMVWGKAMFTNVGGNAMTKYEKDKINTLLAEGVKF